MRPASGTPVYRPDLGVTVMEYFEDGSHGMIGQQLMPIFPVSDKSGSFPVIPAEALLKIPETKRASRGAYNRSDWEYEEGVYNCTEQGHEEPIDDVERKLFEKRAPGVVDEIATRRGLGIISRSQERRIAGKIFNASNFTPHDVAIEWDKVATATPITDVRDGISAFRLQCGMLPNALIIAYSSFQNLKNCTQIVERLKYTFPGIDINKMTSSQLAAIFDVPNVFVGNAVYDSADKGKAKTISDIWNNEYAALARVATSSDPTEPCIGRTFMWDEDSSADPIVEVYREEQIRSDVYRVRHTVDERLIKSYDKDGVVVSDIAAACCYLFSNITTHA